MTIAKNAAEDEGAALITVVIPTRQTPSLEVVLQALANQQPAHLINEILVVGQQDDMERLTRLPKVRYVHVEEQPTPAHNRNVGAAEATTEWIVFLDTDAIPARLWLTAFRASMLTDASVLAGAVAMPEDAGYWARCDNLLAFGTQMAHHGSPRTLESAATINFGIRRALFRELKGFAESFTSAAGEDRDLCWRLQQAGCEIVFVPDAVVLHDHARLDCWRAFQHFYGYGQAAAQFRLLRSDFRRWRLGAWLVRVPLLGEAVGLARIAVRGFLRPFRQPHYLSTNLDALPGVMILDWAHTLGMIHALREANR